jgi:hypothetical protein
LGPVGLFRVADDGDAAEQARKHNRSGSRR